MTNYWKNQYRNIVNIIQTIFQKLCVILFFSLKKSVLSTGYDNKIIIMWYSFKCKPWKFKYQNKYNFNYHINIMYLS